MNQKIILLLSACLLLVSCGSGPAQKNQKTGDSLVPLALSKNFYKRYKGKLGEDLFITMCLQRDSSVAGGDTLLSGNYYYDKIGKPLSLKGSLKKEVEISLTETDELHKKTGLFTGKFTGPETIEGTWKNPLTGKTYPFTLTETKDGFVGVITKAYHHENCDSRTKHLRMHDSINNFTDTMCSYIDMNVAEIQFSNKHIEEVINKAIVTIMCSFVDTNATSIDQVLNSINNLEDPDYVSNEITSNIETNENNVLGLSAGSFSYYGGAAHPNSSVLYYNYDLTTGKEITLDELFLPGYKETLDRVGEKIFWKTYKESDFDGWNFEKGKFTLNQNFLIARGGLAFLFNPYEIGPYAAGAPDIFIPYGEIKQLLKPGGIISRWREK